jgi:hypothetical protein
MDSSNTYFTNYGEFSHMLTIFINEEICENEKSTIISTIHIMINDKQIDKNILGMCIPIKWRVSNETDLLHYYTNVGGLLGDKAVQEHSKMVVNDIKHLISKYKNKISFMVTKPLTEKICML